VISPDDVAYLPNPQLTPGDALDVTTSDICVPGYSFKVRDVPTMVRDQVYQEYGIASHWSGQYQVNHLISLEMGGSSSIRNLWPPRRATPATLSSNGENLINSR
jgi:hypothetical protein